MNVLYLTYQSMEISHLDWEQLSVSELVSARVGMIYTHVVQTDIYNAISKKLDCLGRTVVFLNEYLP